MISTINKLYILVVIINLRPELGISRLLIPLFYFDTAPFVTYES
jgi:hypothetical protein